MTSRKGDPPIVTDTGSRSRRGALTIHGFRRHVTAVTLAVGALFAGGAAIDLFLLWGFQRAADNPSWEFFAIAGTIEGLPRLILGIALAMVALYLAGSTFLLAYRFLGAALLALGLAGLGLAGLEAMDFFALRSAVPPEQQSALVSVAVKTVALGALQAAVLIPAGWRCLRRPA